MALRQKMNMAKPSVRKLAWFNFKCSNKCVFLWQHSKRGNDDVNIFTAVKKFCKLVGLSLSYICTRNTKGGCITVPLTSCLTGLDQSVLRIITKIVSCHTSDSKPVKPEVNSTVILPPLVFPGEELLFRKKLLQNKKDEHVGCLGFFG